MSTDNTSYLSKIAIILVICIVGAYAFRVWHLSGKMPQVEYRLVDGSTLTSQNLRGKVTVVEFWATTCAICVAEMPKLTEMYERYQERGFAVVAVAVSYDTPRAVIEFTQSKNLPFMVAYDADGKVARAWGGINFTPITFVIDRHGRVVKRIEGGGNMVELNKVLEKLLG